MSIEALDPRLQNDLKKELTDKKNTIGCHINVETDAVKVRIPVDGEDRILLFPKREVRELLERLYTE